MAEDRDMRFRFVRGFFVGVHTSREPTADAWQAHCVEVERRRHETRGVLVYTEGGGPNSRQREQLRRALHALEPPHTAILTASGLVRGIVTGLNWFFRSQRVAAFRPDDLDGALSYLEASGALLARDELLRALRANAAEIGVTLPFSLDSDPPDPPATSAPV